MMPGANGFIPPQRIVAGDQPMPQDNTDYNAMLQQLRKLMQGVGFGGGLAGVISRLAGIGGNGSTSGGEDPIGGSGGSGGGPGGPTLGSGFSGGGL